MELEATVFPAKNYPAIFTFLRERRLDSVNWRADHAIHFGVILRKGWGGNRTC